MGPSLARRIRRALDAAGSPRRVLAVARFSEPGLAASLERDGDRARRLRPPRPASRSSGCRGCANVLFLAGTQVRLDRPPRPHLGARTSCVPCDRGAALRGEPNRRLLERQRLPARPARSARRDGRPTRSDPSASTRRPASAASASSSTPPASAARPACSSASSTPSTCATATLVDLARTVLAGEPVDLRRGPRQRDLAGRRELVRLPRPRALREPRSAAGRHGPGSRSRSARSRSASATRFGRAGPFHRRARPRPARGPVPSASRCSARRRSRSTAARVGGRLGRARRPQPRQAHALRGDRWPLLKRRCATALLEGLVIPAHPLALTAERRLDERRQVALTRYYCRRRRGRDRGRRPHHAVRDPRGRPLRAGAAPRGRDRRPSARRATGRRRRQDRRRDRAHGAGRGGGRDWPAAWATTPVLLSLGALARRERERARRPLPARRRGAAARRLLPPAGRRRPRRSTRRFWRRFLEIEHVRGREGRARSTATRPSTSCARSPTSGRAGEVALYTGNDDAIVLDLARRLPAPSRPVRFVGGLLGQWASGRGARWSCSTRSSAAGAKRGDGRPRAPARSASSSPTPTPRSSTRATASAAASPGIHEVLRPPGAAGGPLVPRPGGGALAGAGGRRSTACSPPTRT